MQPPANSLSVSFFCPQKWNYNFAAVLELTCSVDHMFSEENIGAFRTQHEQHKKFYLRCAQKQHLKYTKIKDFTGYKTIWLKKHRRGNSVETLGFMLLWPPISALHNFMAIQLSCWYNLVRIKAVTWQTLVYKTAFKLLQYMIRDIKM